MGKIFYFFSTLAVLSCIFCLYSMTLTIIQNYTHPSILNQKLAQQKKTWDAGHVRNASCSNICMYQAPVLYSLIKTVSYCVNWQNFTELFLMCFFFEVLYVPYITVASSAKKQTKQNKTNKKQNKTKHNTKKCIHF